MACKAIAIDNGAINRMEPEPPEYTLAYFGNHIDLDLAEVALSRLGTDQFTDFTIGEENQQRMAAGSNIHLQLLHVVLNRWFEEGMP